MKSVVLFTITCLLFACVANGQNPQSTKLTAGALLNNCRNADLAVQHKAYDKSFKKTDKVGTEEIYYAGVCYGYIQGWMEARDKTTAVVDGKVYVITVMDAKLSDVYVALDKYLRDKPLDKGKLADTVLFTLFEQNGLIKPEEVGRLPQVQQTVN